jgi:hypothetical protein
MILIYIMIAFVWNLEVNNKMSDITDTVLMKKAELLMELRDYSVEKLRRSKAKIDIKASKPNSDEMVLMRIIAKSNLAENAIGVDEIRRMKTALKEQDFDKVILFGNRFTSAAQKEMKDDDIEFFSTKMRVFSTLDKQELYSSVIECVNELCQIKCGHVPQSEVECKGHSEAPIQCSLCGGNGRTKDFRCTMCAGTGLRAAQYSCDVRLLSDNADFHAKHGWRTLLQKDLSSILKILITENSKHQITETIIKGNGGDDG